MPRKSNATEPKINEMPTQKMAVVYAKGDPNEVLGEIMPALYGSVYTLKFSRKKQGLPDFKVSASRARYPNAHLVKKSEWEFSIGIPIPEDVTALPQKIPKVEVKIETWQYGTVAQILHLGSYSEEEPTIKRLHQFIIDNGYEIAGVHEEEYLSRPEAKTMKTIIRYQIKKAP